MKAFITGGTGFIGSHLIDYLIDQKIEVRALVRKNEKWLDGKNYTRISGDLNDLEALKKGMEGVDLVYHLAGLVMAPSQEVFNRTNVEATENVYRIAVKSNVRHVIVLSSLAAAGPGNGSPVTESGALNPVSMYGRSKKKMEERLGAIAKSDTPITILRPPAVYGPREEQIFTVFKIAHKGLFPIVGNGESPRVSLVHVRDVIQGIWLASLKTKSKFDVYYISSNHSYTWHEIYDSTKEALGKKMIPLHINPSLVRKMGGISENIASFFGHYPVFNSEKANEMGLEWTCSAEKARLELGYEQEINLTFGIKETIQWYKKHLWL